MKNTLYKLTKANVLIIMITLLLICALAATSAQAAETEIIKEFTVENLVTRVDRNGQDYARFIAQEQRELNGTKYSIGIPVMTFSGSAPEAYQAIAAKNNGDKVTAIVQQRDYRGRPSYTVLAVIQ